MYHPRRPHAVYLVSLWQAQTEGEPTWRAWLENPSTGERRGFATLTELFAYLKIKISLLECEPDLKPEQSSIGQDLEDSPRPPGSAIEGQDQAEEAELPVTSKPEQDGGMPHD